MEDALHHLKPIIIQRKRYAQADRSLYRVYAAPGQYELIEATTAHEAFEKSGIRRPHKIERETLLQHTALTPEHLGETLDEPVAFDPSLPDPADMASGIFAAILDSADGTSPVLFEDLLIDQLNRKPAPEALPETATPAPVGPPEAPAIIAAEVTAAPEPPSEALTPALAEEPEAPEAALTPEQVDALLNGEEL